VYADQQTPTNESDMNSRVTSLYIAAIFLAMNSFNSILDVFQLERNMMYRHKFAAMYDELAFLLAFVVAEVPFVLVTSMLFVAPFYFLVGLDLLAYKFFWFYLFFTLNLFVWTFLGQVSKLFVRLNNNTRSTRAFRCSWLC
jgi:ABC-type multidrug transport system permease subunit